MNLQPDFRWNVTNDALLSVTSPLKRKKLVVSFFFWMELHLWFIFSRLAKMKTKFRNIDCSIATFPQLHVACSGFVNVWQWIKRLYRLHLWLNTRSVLIVITIKKNINKTDSGFPDRARDTNISLMWKLNARLSPTAVWWRKDGTHGGGCLYYGNNSRV